MKTFLCCSICFDQKREVTPEGLIASMRTLRAEGWAAIPVTCGGKIFDTHIVCPACIDEVADLKDGDSYRPTSGETLRDRFMQRLEKKYNSAD